jgi:hypothetical protein
MERINIESDSASLYGDEPPRLEYDLRSKKLRIGFFWSMVLLDSMVIPIVLYFALWKGSGLDHSTGEFTSAFRLENAHISVYNIISATLAGTCIFEYFQRWWVLGKKGSTCRVSGAKWYYVSAPACAICFQHQAH